MFTTNAFAKLHLNNRGQLVVSSCHQLNVTESFEVSKFRGVWYEVFAYPDTITKGGKCVMSSYASGADGKVTILKRFVDHRGLQTRLSGMGVNPIPGILAVSFFAMREIYEVSKVLRAFNLHFQLKRVHCITFYRSTTSTSLLSHHAMVSPER